MNHFDVKINIDGRLYGEHCKHHILAVLLNIKYEYKIENLYPFVNLKYTKKVSTSKIENVDLNIKNDSYHFS